ncbi:MAG: hypothetical protein RBR35_15380 [Salinivirgaceae bacterium]|nr:hypothetical protein [Salinivirgaceae bacterium]
MSNIGTTNEEKNNTGEKKRWQIRPEISWLKAFGRSEKTGLMVLAFAGALREDGSG